MRPWINKSGLLFIGITTTSVTAANVQPLVATFEGVRTQRLVRANHDFERATIPAATVQNEYIQYRVNITVGTPPQTLQSILDTAVGDTMVISWLDPECENNRCTGGVFNQNSSSTFTTLGDFSAKYQDYTNASGVYAQDVLSIGGVSINNFEFGLAMSGTHRDNILGIGPKVLEDTNDIYPNLPQRMHNQGLTNIVGYSIYLNNDGSFNGEIAFGGIDTGMYYGEFTVLPILSISSTPGYATVSMDSMVLQSDSHTRFLQGSSLDVIIDPAATLDALPVAIFNSIADFTGFQSLSGSLVKPFGDIDNSTLFNFTFGSTTISVPITSMLKPWNTTHSWLYFRTNGGNVYTLGMTFFRAAYVVFDFTNNQISVAPLVTDSSSQNITAIPAKGVTGIAGLSLSNQSSANRTSTNGAGSAGSSSKGLSTGAKAGIGIGAALGVLALIALIVAAILIPRRRHRKLAEREKPAYEVAGNEDGAYGHKVELAQSNRLFDKSRQNDAYRPGTPELSGSTVQGGPSDRSQLLGEFEGSNTTGGDVTRKPVAAPVEMAG